MELAPHELPHHLLSNAIGPASQKHYTGPSYNIPLKTEEEDDDRNFSSACQKPYTYPSYIAPKMEEEENDEGLSFYFEKLQGRLCWFDEGLS